MKMTKFAPDPFIATAIFGSAAFHQPESLDDVVGEEVDDELQEPFALFFDQAALHNLGLCKSSDEPVRTSGLAKAAAIRRKFGIARTEERLITDGSGNNTRWIVAFDADGNLVDQQELEPGPLGKRSDGWDDEFTPSTSSPNRDLHKRSSAPLAQGVRIERTRYPSGACVCAEIKDGVVIRTYHEEQCTD